MNLGTLCLNSHLALFGGSSRSGNPYHNEHSLIVFFFNRFAHDRYAQAVASTKQAYNHQKMHFIVAQTLMKYASGDDSTLYSRAHHICLSAALIKQQVPHRIRYRDVLYHAALTASQSGARPSALSYYQTCLFLLQDEAWRVGSPDVFYDETRELHIQTAETLLSQGQLTEAMNLLDVVFAQAHTAACKARAWALKSRIYIHNGDVVGATGMLFHSLSELGVNVSEQPTWDECDAAYIKLSSYLRCTDLGSLFSRPLSEDRELVAVAGVMCETIAVCAWAEPLKFYQLAVEMMNIYIYRGAFPHITFLCTHLSMIALGRFKDLGLGMKLGDIAVRFMNTYEDSWIPAVGGTFHNFFVSHLREPMSSTLPVIENSLENAFLLGERYLILINICAMAVTRFFLGHEMVELENFCNDEPEGFIDWTSDIRGGVNTVSIR